MKPIVARVHLASPPEKVYAAIATDAGRTKFWAVSAVETGGVIRFVFANGMKHAGRVLRDEAPRHFAVHYFGGSTAAFTLEPDGGGGTDLTLSETGVSETDYADQRAGWVSVLLALKAAVDHGVDIRNDDTKKRWEDGYVDV
ncbi:MAG: hypothetical protein HKN20_11635 [Gemmatimonadetes bacterium]|nr:hypothetical protein [Gemmatimonadota bacterium]